MKKLPFLYVFFLSLLLLAFINNSIAQLSIGSDTKWISSNDTYVTLDNIGLQYNAAPAFLNSTFQFTGNNTSVIGGSSQPDFNTILIAKTGSGNAQLNSDINISDAVRFRSGLFYLHNHNVFLAPAALLENESETSRFTDTANGTISISILLNAPQPVNPGNLGAYISSASYSGNIYVSRGHHLQNINNDFAVSIERYYDVQLEDKAGISATMRLYYFDAEKNGLNEDSLSVWKSNDNVSWNNLGFTSRNSIANYVEKTGVDAFARFTLYKANGALPVLGLHLSGIWKNDYSVLNWTTLTELNNLYFDIERKYPQENSFTKIASVVSKHADGNSQVPTAYTYTDASVSASAPDILYRLKQVDKNGQVTYSNTTIVKPSAIKEFIHNIYPTTITGNHIYIQTGNMNIAKMQVQVYDMLGKRLVNQSLPYQSQWLPLPYMSSGIYRLLIRSGEWKYNSTIIR